MKTLDKMNLTDKAELFHALFKKEIPELLNCIEGICNAITTASPEKVTAWDGGIFKAEISYTLVTEAAAKIKEYGKKLYNNGRIFADQLFDGYQGVFTVYCIRQCLTKKRLDNPKLQQAVELFFNS